MTIAPCFVDQRGTVRFSKTLDSSAVKGGSHDALFALRYAGRDKDGSAASQSEAFPKPCLYLLLCEASRALHLHEHGLHRRCIDGFFVPAKAFWLS